MLYYATNAERWCCAKPGKIVRLSGLLRRFKAGRFIVPCLALAFASAAGAETAPKPSAAPNGSSAASGSDAKPAAEQPKPESSAKPDTKPESADSSAKTPPAQAGSQILINVDKTHKLMTVFVDGIDKYSWPVATGRDEYSTRSGTFTPTSMNEVWYSKQWDNSPMPHSIFFMKDGHAIHGSHEVKTLGKAVSHGCVRISPANAAVLYDMVKTNGMQNTKVVLAGVTPGGEAKVAEQPADQRYGEADGGPGFAPGPGYYPQPAPRRGLFGGWFRGPYYNGPQGYNRPPGYYAPRGYRGGY